MEVIDEAARVGADLVFTFCYKKRHDDLHVLALTKLVEDQGGEVCFVQLWCDKKRLEERVARPDRVALEKIATVELLRATLAKADLFAAVSFRPSLRIDTTSTPPEEAAARIVEHYKLSRAIERIGVV